MNTKKLQQFTLYILLFSLFCMALPPGNVVGQTRGNNTKKKTSQRKMPQLLSKIPQLSNKMPQLLKERATISKPKEIELIPDKNFAGIFIIKFVEGSHIRNLKGNFTISKDQLNKEELRRLERLNLSPGGVVQELERINEMFREYGEKYGFAVFSTFAADEQNQKDPDAQFREKEKLEIVSGQELADLDLYFTVAARDFKDLEAQQKFMNALNESPIIEDVHATVLAENATVKTDARQTISAANFPFLPTPDLSSQQGYLNAAPVGIDARYAWTKDGGKGNGVKMIDVEFNWQTNHEDFAPVTNFFWGNHNICSDIPATDHGTGVMGILNAPHNGYGISGIAPDIRYGLANVCQVQAIPGFIFSLFSGENVLGRTHNIAVAVTIYKASAALGSGDILLIEQHTFGVPSGATCTWADCSQWEFVPMEYYRESFDAIQRATARSIVVAEAAGNGGMNLDDSRYNRRFDSTFRHSGALLVGAGNGAGNNSRASFSNFGARIDVQGWGGNVVTTGYGGNINGMGNRIAPWNTGDVRSYYTPNFGGTSSASPIVAGAVASIQGARRARGLAFLNGSELRTLLVQTGTPQGPGALSENIGPLPNLRGAIDSTLGSTSPSTTSTGGFTGPGTYFIQAKHSGKFLEVFGGAIGALAPLAPIVQFDNYNGETQKFIVESRSGGFVAIQSKYSRQCLDVFSFAIAPIHLEQMLCNNLDNQLFAIEPVGNFYRIKVKHSGLYFAIAGASSTNSIPLMQYRNTGADNQLFQFIPTR